VARARNQPAAKRPAAKKPSAKPAIERPYEAFKVELTPTFCIRNEQGQIVREEKLPVVITLWEPNFDKLRGELEELIPQIDQIKAQAAGPAPGA